MKKLMYISIMAIVVGFGCKKGFLSELQNNPNAPTSSAATPPLVLPGTINGLASIVNGVGFSNGYQGQAVWEGYWNYSGGYSFNQTVQEYVMSNTSPQVWGGYYSILSNLNVIIQQSTGVESYTNYKNIAKILSAVCYKNLVDAYNDVPYTQALQGAGNFYPAYDKGSDIYDSIVQKLDDAMAEINGSLSNAAVLKPAGDDIMFGGDMDMWVRFANTVKLKCLVQQSAVASKQAAITAEAGKTNSYGYLESDAIVNPGYNATQQGAFYSNFGVSTSGGLNGSYNYIRAGGLAVDFYKATNDPRLGYFYSVKATQPTDDDYYTPSDSKDDYYGDYLGIQVTQPTKGSGIGPGLVKNKTANVGQVMMLAAEAYFVRSEATLRGYIGGGDAGAKALYQAGVQASFDYLGAGSADDYLAQDIGDVQWPATFAAKLETLLDQKWAALNGISNAEGWNDWRRTGFPAFPGTLSPTATNHHMPYRYYYPLEEPTTNQAAWLAAGGDKVNPFTDKIFWMP